VTDEFLSTYFSNGTTSNLGVVVRRPWVFIDLDSKKDQGASVRAWLDDQPAQAHLKNVPRYSTGNGERLVFVCYDLPQFKKSNGKRYEKALISHINEKLTIELYYDGLNIVLPPSIHPNGSAYEWRTKGEVPTVTWSQLQQWFGFRLPTDEGETTDSHTVRRQNKAAWWAKYQGDLRTLDIAELFHDAGMLGDLVTPDENKYSALCPWRTEHGDKAEAADDSSTVIFAPPDSMPGFSCLHAHCAERHLAEVLDWFELAEPGCVDLHCKRMRVFQPGQTAQDGRPRLILPGVGRSASDFAKDAGAAIATSTSVRRLFLRNGLVVEISQIQFAKGQLCLGFAVVKPARLITLMESYAEVGFLTKDDLGNDVFNARSMDKNTAEVVLAAQQFREQLPVVERILDVPIPILTPEGIICYPSTGYDPRFMTYLAEDAPKIERMPVADALALLRELYFEFCFRTAQDITHAIAALITPFCRGLFGRWTARTPTWFHGANRARAGKDCEANLASILYEGRTNEDAPLTADVAETRKKITSALIAGRRRIHFANCKGHINNSAFESIGTAEVWTDRVLGGNTTISLPNEMEISLSANTGLTYTPDLDARCRPIMLFYSEEDPNARTFQRPDLHGWLRANRGRVLSAIAALVDHWDMQGRPSGPSPFTSYPLWAKVVGGIMTSAGLGDPCLPVPNDGTQIAGDQQTGDMKTLFALAHEQFNGEWVNKGRIMELLEGEGTELFGWLDLESRGGRTSFALLLNKHVGRVLGGIRLERNASAKKSQQHTYRFVKDAGGSTVNARAAMFDTVFNSAKVGESPSGGGHVGHLGHLPYTPYIKTNSSNNIEMKNKEREIYKSIEQVPNVPKVPASSTIPCFDLVTSSDALKGIADQITAASEPVALDIETYGAKGGLDPWQGDIRLLSLAIPGVSPWVLDLKAIGYDLGPLGAVLPAKPVLGHNIKFDALWLRVKCGLVLRNVLDTMTASRLLTNGTKEPNDLGAIISRHLQIDLPKDQGRSDWGAMALSEEQLRYAADDVHHLHALHGKLQGELEKAGLLTVYETEMDLLPVVVDIEARGFAIDKVRLAVLSKKAAEERDTAATVLRQTFNAPALNPASPAQLKTVLAGVGITLESTGEEALQASGDDRFVPHILAYRNAQKRTEQTEKLLQKIGPDGRIHGRFEPTGTETGRFSSKDPNLQNIARGELRNCFVASPGCSLVVADYSQIELRAAAAIANEPKMIEAYRQGADLHKQTASLVLGISPDAVSKEDRQLAKAVNFGLLYGMYAATLVKYAKTSYGVTLTDQQAVQMRERFFNAYRGLRRWHDKAGLEAGGAKEVRTLLGRRRMLPAGFDKRWARFSTLLNTPVQGSCADGMKKAILLVASRLPYGAGIVSTVHDELIVETPSEQAEAVNTIVHDAMVEAMAAIFPQVPIVVDCKACQTWGEK